MSTPERRPQSTAEIVERTGIDEPMIEALVHAFYAKVRLDPLLAPVFRARIEDWGPHLERMCAFWSSVALLSGRYHGRPTEKHAALPIDARHFDRWLALFEETARELCPPAAATHFLECARRIAESLELSVAGQQGVLLRQGERFHRASPGQAEAVP
jgi:hemoglobin